MRSLLVRLTFSLALVVLLGLPTATAFAQAEQGPTLIVENPAPGDMLTLGKLEMQGVAFDPLATTGSGVDRVSVFLDNRDEGGLHLGDATLGMPNPVSSEPAQFAQAGWQLTTPVLNGAGDGHMLFIYARSGVTGDETILKIPVSIGEEATHSTGNPADVVIPGGTDYVPAAGESTSADTGGM